MKVGDLVRVRGRISIILSQYEHRSALESTDRAWYTVLIKGTPKAFREDYLEVVSENR